jgi:phage/plasmid-like protein (TIGR03299 family)
MAHELDRRPDGTATMFAVGATPWHREGHLLGKAPSLQEALEMAGHDFTVHLRTVHALLDSGDGPEPQVTDGGVCPGCGWIEAPAPDSLLDGVCSRCGRGDLMRSRLRPTQSFFAPALEHSAVVRTDTGQVLGVVGTRYTPLQNRDAFGILTPLLDSGLASLETGGTLRGGQDVWMLVRFHLDDPRVSDALQDEVAPFGLISNNHAGKRGVLVQETPIRVVCANTLGLATRAIREQIAAGTAAQVKHTAGVEKRTAEAAETLWARIRARYQRFAEQYRDLRRTVVTPPQFEKLVVNIATPMPPHLLEGGLTRQQEAARDRVLKRQLRLRQLWTDGIDHRGDHSAWEAYGALAQSIDHDERLWGAVSRVGSLMGGRLGELKQQVLDGLYEATQNPN